MVEYQFKEALNQLYEFHSYKSKIDEVEKALDYITKCNNLQACGNLQMAIALYNEIIYYYSTEKEWLTNFERPYVNFNQRSISNLDFWQKFKILKQMIPFYCLLKIGKSELVKSLIKTTIEPNNNY